MNQTIMTNNNSKEVMTDDSSKGVMTDENSKGVTADDNSKGVMADEPKGVMADEEEEEDDAKDEEEKERRWTCAYEEEEEEEEKEWPWEERLWDAVFEEDAAEVDELLKSPDRQSLDYLHRNMSPLILATEIDNKDLAERILNAGASANFCDRLENTPLINAAGSGNVELCQLLLNHGANVHLTQRTISSKRPRRVNALYRAASYNHYETVALLLNHGAQSFDPALAFEWSPFAEALRRNYSRIVELFLEDFEKRRLWINLRVVFSQALNDKSEECAVTALCHGYFPIDTIKIKSKNSRNHGCVSCFHMCAHFGLIKIMSAMSEFNPRYLQEAWLVEKRIPTELSGKAEYVSWLLEHRQQPASLMKLCRHRILPRLGQYYKRSIDSLPLPPPLKRFLTNFESAFDQN